MKIPKRLAGGRPRIVDVARSPSGRIKHRRVDARATVLNQRLARGATAENAHHIEHECPLGRLLMAGKISRGQYDAGARFRDLDRQYRMINGIAPPHTRAADWDRGGRLLKPDMDPGRVDTIRRHFLTAYNRMMAAGPAAYQEVVNTVIYEREVMMLGNLTAGLDALAYQ